MLAGYGGERDRFCASTNLGANNSPALIEPLLQFPIIPCEYRFEVSALPFVETPLEPARLSKVDF